MRHHLSCADCYNGLYRVYIETEKTFDKNDPSHVEAEAALIESVRRSLMEHRNLCEDFDDIMILCKKKIGLCADIELEDGFDPPTVFSNMVEALRDFFSPAPKYYTLKQLMEEKGRSIQEAFSGRPYGLKESHGFVDTEEFEAIQLRKEIHLSDVYQVIFNVAGVRNITNLAWRKNCDDPATVADSSWVWRIPENHVPEFAPDCSVMRFSRRGLPVAYDFEKLNALFNIDFRQTGKVLYNMPSPYLDAAMPEGVYHSDLGQYQSIQTEFPKVYGIEEGGLPLDASRERRAKAYQLKAYLLFFDQLLANYVAQLKNIRSLFSMSGAGNGNGSHTYFLNQLTDVPDLKKLLRFRIDGESESFLGTEGSILAVPVDKRALENLIDSGAFETACEGWELPAYEFCSMGDANVAIRNTEEDLYNGNWEVHAIANKSDCWYFYFFTSSEKIAFVSKTAYRDEPSAIRAAAAVRYAGGFSENFRAYGNQHHKFSFFMELGISGYSDYLQRLIEDKSSYRERRDEFLDHLLSRFAETFTDFALLSYGFMNADDLRDAGIRSKEYFLTHYDDLSSNRGRAFDYLYNNRGVNISGFEKRAGALAGIQSEQRNTLCNFVVEEYEEHFHIAIKLADGELMFRSTEKFYSREVAENAVKDLVESLRDERNYEETGDETQGYALRIHYGDRQVLAAKQYATRHEIHSLRNGLYQLFSFTPDREHDIVVSRHVYKVILRDRDGKEIASSKKFFDEERKAQEYAARSANTIGRPAHWTFAQGTRPFDKIVFDNTVPEELKFLDRHPFKKDINDTIIGKPGKYEFELLDRLNNFKFSSVGEYDSAEQAEEACWKLLVPLARPDAYEPERDGESGRYRLKIRQEDGSVARTDPYFRTEGEARNAAQEINELITPHQYNIRVERRDYRWSFLFLLGYIPGHQFRFRSAVDYADASEAFKHALEYYSMAHQLQMSTSKNSVLLTPVGSSLATVFDSPDGRPPGEELKREIENDVQLKKQVYELVHESDPSSYAQFVTNDVDDSRLKFVYRLVDKDKLYGCYIGEYPSDDPNAIGEFKKALFQNPAQPKFTIMDTAGDINERKDAATNAVWYHYTVRCMNEQGGAIRDLVLFESVRGYESRDDASKAFDKDYMEILNRARDEKNYGPDLFITLDTQLIHETDNCRRSGSVVFVPEKTREFFNWYPDVVIRELKTLAELYPVRYATRADDEFYTLFPCEEDTRDPNAPSFCTPKENLVKYYYYLVHDMQNKPLWQSVQYYDRPAEALSDFYFLLRLLLYPGNYFTKTDVCDCTMQGEKSSERCVCKTKIYIREVLAESKRRYFSPAQAWGKDGVEEFICVAQTEKAFRTYVDSNDCRFTFDLACNESGLIHPCSYDTPEKRDHARERLIKAANAFQQADYPSVDLSSAGHELLVDADKNVFATVFRAKDREVKRTRSCVADILFDILNNPVYEDDNGFHLNIFETDANGKKILIKYIEPGDPTISVRDWKQKLCLMACRYPVVRNSNGKYEVVIRLPGFGDECAGAGEPVPCDDRKKEVCPDCDIAWRSACCFNTCNEAMAFLDQVSTCLKDPSNYLNVFDCECGPYGIRLDCCDLGQKPANDNWYRSDRRQMQRMPVDCFNEIIAFNPQTYVSPKEDCAAVQRAKKLINAEGLLLVEHILLRPRCEEDCACMIQPCDVSPINCNDWTWQGTGPDDPCDEHKMVHFQPSKDPYSFIATVVLPAWSARFRKIENRQLVEDLLYRETPAHILLRILWLAPKECCHFETQYYSWNRWLSNRHACSDDFSLCDFTGFLFRTDFECLPECDACKPCEDTTVVPKGCWEDTEAPADLVKNKYLNQLNEVFCWMEITCGVKEASPQIPQQTPTTVPYDQPQVLRAGSVAQTGPVETLPGEMIRERQKEKEIRRRAMRYKHVADNVVEVSRGNPLARKVQVFLQGGQPGINELSSLLMDIVKNASPRSNEAKPLKHEQAQDLVQSCVGYYLDKIIFEDDPENITELKTLMEKLRAAKIDMQHIYNYWDAAEAKKYEKKLNTRAVKELLVGKSKRK